VKFIRTLLALGFMLASGSALAADGSELFAKDCAGCHGADAKADTPAAKAMKTPALVGHDATGTVEHVRQSPKHAALSKKLSDEDLQAIADHLAAM